MLRYQRISALFCLPLVGKRHLVVRLHESTLWQLENHLFLLFPQLHFFLQIYEYFFPFLCVECWFIFKSTKLQRPGYYNYCP